MSQKQLRKLRELRQEAQGVPENREVPMESSWATFGKLDSLGMGFGSRNMVVVNWNITMSMKL